VVRKVFGPKRVTTSKVKQHHNAYDQSPQEHHNLYLSSHIIRMIIPRRAGEGMASIHNFSLKERLFDRPRHRWGWFKKVLGPM
jgi:hypothetical protein